MAFHIYLNGPNNPPSNIDAPSVKREIDRRYIEWLRRTGPMDENLNEAINKCFEQAKGVSIEYLQW